MSSSAGEFMTVSSLFSPKTPSSGRINATLERARAWREALIGDTPGNRRLYFHDQPWTVDLQDATTLGRNELAVGNAIPVISRLFAPVVVKSHVNALNRKVRELHQRASLAADEHGQWTLQHIHGLMHITIGEGDDHSKVVAPIFVQPVRLDPVGSPVRDWMVEATGPWDINRELLFRLARDRGAEPDPQDILSAFTTSGFDAGVRVLTARVGSDWRVEEREVIDLLVPSPLAPLVELERLMGRLPKLPLVAAVAGSSEAQEEVVKAVRVSMPRDLPDRLDYDEDLLVLDADSSQHQAINMALAGSSLVVQGPPGTGKSQTIANMAAAMAARGQRVLITSPKAVALDNLVARLDTIGLGELVADVRAVREVHTVLGELTHQIADLDGSAPIATPTSIGDQTIWDSLRRDLAAWVDVMHTPREPWGVSYFEARHEYLRLGDTPTVPGWTMSRTALENLDAEGRARTRGDLRSWSSLRQKVDAAGVPWTADRISDDGTVQEILETVSQIKDEWLPAAIIFRRNLAAANTLTRIPTIARWAEILELIEGMQETQALLGEDAFSGELDELFTVYTSRKDKALRVFDREYRDTLRRLKAMFDESAHPGMTIESVTTTALEQQAQWRSLAHTRVPEGLDGFSEAKEVHQNLHDALAWLSTLLSDMDLCEMTHDEVSAVISKMADSEEVIALLPELAGLDDQIRAAHVYPIVDAVRLGDLPAELVQQAFDAEWLRALIHVITTEDQTLRSFDGRDANARLEAWQQADRAHLQVNRNHTLDVMRERGYQVLQFKRDEVEAIRQSLDAQDDQRVWRDRRRIQRLWRQAPNVLPTLRPIWVMGPDDVAEVLPTDAVFDVVIVDEASLMKPERAVGALARARRLIVVGDQRQLPPVARRWTTDQPSEVTDDRSRDNLMDIASAFLPVVNLDWSHRAYDARLINVVAEQVYPEGFYGFPGTMATSPIVVTTGEEHLIDAVVDTMIRHAIRYPERSLGVVCPSMDTTVAVSETLAQRLTTSEGTPAAPFFTHGDDEPVFVKPVDAVQGEERDVMIMMLPRTEFDAYVGDLGLRRGVVAATRARLELHLMTDLNDNELAELKAYQDPGAQLMSTLLEGDQAAYDQYLDDFNRPLFDAIAEGLEEAGMPVATGVGQPPMGVRLAICHPVQRERIVLAIGVDGVLYRDLPTVRDRERIHPDGLGNRGWAVHRMWIHEWFTNPTSAIDQVRIAWEAAVKITDQRDREAQERREALSQSITDKRERQEAEARELATAQQRMRQAAMAQETDHVDEPIHRAVVDEIPGEDPTSEPSPTTIMPMAPLNEMAPDAQASESLAQPSVATPQAGTSTQRAPKTPVSTPAVISLQPDTDDGRPNLPKGLKIERHSADDLAALAAWILATNPAITDDQVSAEMMGYLGYTRKGKRIQSRFERAIRNARKR
ncbi:AAA domain-containing protein [Stomatohabitans albus]|uniref:AAA domain-containing protein n=1 Tax=Stomatohabitans albus TaxID=3110766 RepID=UPI00300D17F1